VKKVAHFRHQSEVDRATEILIRKGIHWEIIEDDGTGGFDLVVDKDDYAIAVRSLGPLIKDDPEVIEPEVMEPDQMGGKGRGQSVSWGFQSIKTAFLKGAVCTLGGNVALALILSLWGVKILLNPKIMIMVAILGGLLGILLETFKPKR